MGALVVAADTLYWTYQDYWTTSSRSRMGGLLENVFPCEAPVSPSEVTDLVQSMEIEHCE